MNEDKATLIEEWKDVQFYEGRYQVSNLGRIKSLVNKERILIPQRNAQGYLHVSLCKNGKRNNHMISRLVMRHFIPNPESKPCVNHIDGNKNNNTLKNLEWCTYSENIKHAYRNGLRGKYGYKSKLNEHSVRVIRHLLGWDEDKKWIASIFNISITHLYNIKSNVIWKIKDQ